MIKNELNCYYLRIIIFGGAENMEGKQWKGEYGVDEMDKKEIRRKVGVSEELPIGKVLNKIIKWYAQHYYKNAKSLTSFSTYLSTSFFLLFFFFFFF